MKIKVNDHVLVNAGKYKGKTGKVMRLFENTDRLTVEKINIRTKHVRKTANRAGETIKYEAPFHVSNVSLICPSCKKATRVGYAIPKEGKKYRVCKHCKESVEQSVSKASKKKA